MEIDELTIKRIIDVYKSIQGTGNTVYQNRFYYKQLKKYRKYGEQLGI